LSAYFSRQLATQGPAFLEELFVRGIRGRAL